MNSRQRRGVVLLTLSVLCAIAAFFGVVAVVGDVDSKVGSETTAYELDQDIPAYQPLSPGQFHRVSVPKRWLPATAVTDLGDVNGKIAAAALSKGSLLQTDMVSDRPQLRPGEQEIAIMVDAETGVAGTIVPGDQVNIFATFANGGPGGKPESRIIVSDARVLEIGKITQAGQTSDQNDSRDPGKQVPITFALQTEDAQRVAYAESFATKVRLALVAPGSPSVPQDQRTYTLDGDK
ncbi:Flp pilus assembly protein CpaB [Streptomyces sp. ICBB 8177]|uniref:Flp pilus assembly protein CpaB n=1 Tax=Streptomyces sp. ICBB 8177 TaxID=563922 RepID=UPI000D676841|nr:Flp pilus assembly protein CpaB [Streptomyces sp. ICBB 8177]PWI43859.1 Flp pilus assembly protein CpaB [Streptomyces sp. ICBB 8177]